MQTALPLPWGPTPPLVLCTTPVEAKHYLAPKRTLQPQPKEVVPRRTKPQQRKLRPGQRQAGWRGEHGTCDALRTFVMVLASHRLACTGKYVGLTCVCASIRFECHLQDRLIPRHDTMVPVGHT